MKSKKAVQKKEVKFKVTPLEYLRFVMEQMDFKQTDLVKGGCGTKGHVSEMVNGRRRMTLNFIRNFLRISHREKLAHILIQDYPLLSFSELERTKKECETCKWRESEIGYYSPCPAHALPLPKKQGKAKKR